MAEHDSTTGRNVVTAGTPVSGTPGVRPPTPLRTPYLPDKADGLLAAVAFLLGFLFIRWVFFIWQGWGVALFTALYVISVVTYLRHKGKGQTGEARFWMVILLVVGLSYALWPLPSINFWRNLFLFGVAVYWVAVAGGLTLLGKTSDWLALDGLHALVLVPFRNFSLQYRSLPALFQSRQSSQKQILSVGLGLLFALIITSLVFPLLIQADNGGFAAIWDNLHWLRFETKILMLQSIFAIPTAAYLFALVAGCAHKRAAQGFEAEPLQKALKSVRVLPLTTVTTTIGLVSMLYLVFIFSQLPYFFSAFAGERPAGWQVYSEYARNGFFELCRIAIINLSVLALGNLSSKVARQESRALRGLNTLLSLLTLLLIGTAFSKMALYIKVYGLSVQRLLPCVFMAFLAIICAGIVVLQRRSFSIMRLAAGVGAIMLTALCLFDPDAFVTRSNAARYLAGALPKLDTEILYRSGPAGVSAALVLFEQVENDELKKDLAQYLQGHQYRSENLAGQTKDTLQTALARRRLAPYAEQLKEWSESLDSNPFESKPDDR